MRATGETELAACPRLNRLEVIWSGVLAVLLALAVTGSYSNTSSAPFVFDDLTSIPANPTIRHVWPPGAPLSPPPGGRTVSGRPILNFSFAINHAFGRLDVRGYHAVNLAVHVLAAWTLFALARRTLAKMTIGAAHQRARFLGFAIALVWALHPLNTEAVTYVVQRAESLMGLFYLLTLYCFVRGAEAQTGEGAGLRSGGWYGLAIAACFLGAATKEVMVSAPVIVLLYDRAFLAGSIARSLRIRRAAYAGLFCSWLLLGWLMIVNGNRGDTAGLGNGWAAASYACTQFGAVLHYLRLAVWPYPLVFDYGTTLAPGAWLLWAGGVGILLACTCYALWRNQAAGFLGAWFFLLLAPTSSFVPIATEPIAEHRMYLPLVAVVAAGICASSTFCGAIGRRFSGWPGLLVLGLALGGLTYARNADYRSELSLWRDTVAKRPDNPAARHNLALAFENAGDIPAALAQYTAAVRLDPGNAKTRNNFGKILKRSGRPIEAAAEFRAALRDDPDYAEAHNNLGVMLAIDGNFADAMRHFDRAVALKSDYAEAHQNRGLALRVAGRATEAEAEFVIARRLKSAPTP